MLDNNNLIPSNLNPIVLFKTWFELAIKTELTDPNAMILSTISKNKPSSRVMLLKSYDSKGFVFYTNSKSNKGQSISTNNSIALNFHWKSQKRQVRIEGLANIISNNESDEYFDSRPLGSKIGAWASKQSEILDKRATLIKKIEEIEANFKDKKVPRPNYWNGYLVIPQRIEFWQEMPYRLHDRVEYILTRKKWESKRLFP